MDLFYEQTGPKTDSLETLTLPSTEEAKNKEINRKTEQSFERLEDEISKTYNLVETKASGWGSSFSSFLNKNLNLDKYINDTKKSLEELQLNEKLNEAKTKLNENVKTINTNLKTEKLMKDLSSKTSQYLDDLDKELEQVENVTGDYFNKFTNIIKSTIVIDQEDKEMNEDEEIDVNKEGNLMFNVGHITSNRTEAQYDLLNTSKDVYLSNKHDATFLAFSKKFQIDSQTEEISKRLQSSTQLKKIFNEIVPEKVSYSEFWCIYFYNVSLIQTREEKRKELLNKNNMNEEEKDETLEWEEEEEEEVIESNVNSPKAKTSSEGSYVLNSVDSSTLEVNKATVTKSKNEIQKSENSEEKDDNDDSDDDDWE